MEIITKNNVTARGKQNILLMVETLDRELYFNTIVSDILSIANCAIFAVDSEEEVDASKFVAGILIVSENLIKNKREILKIYNSLISNQTPIIPIAVQPRIKNEFSKEFGKLQCIVRENKKNLDRYHKELSSRLKTIIASEKTVGDIKNAFGCRVFLSYRKSDAEKARRVIKFLRKNKKLEEAAIWYDDYLIPGDNYEIEIEEEIKNCDIFVLVVTNNVLEKSRNLENGKLQDNYVIRVEYPLALKYKKPIIPIMVDSIEKNILLENFQNIGDAIPCDKKYELEQRIKQIGISSRNKEDDSYLQYLIGTAFLNGIFTEIDVKKGVKILKRAAESGQKESIVKLARMYYEGDHVTKNWQYSARYYKQLIDEVEKDNSITDYPYCYNNYASASVSDSLFNRNYLELISIFESGISILRENKNDDNEYLFYFALTLAGYRNAIFQAMYDEILEQSDSWKQKRDMAGEEAIAILDELLLRDKHEEKYWGLKVALEKEKAENASSPEAQYMYHKENKKVEIEKEIEKMYTIAINDMKILYELNPLVAEEEYIELLYQASVSLLMASDNREKVSEWANECIKVCEVAIDNLNDEKPDRKIEFYKNNITFVIDYISMDLLSFIRKYNEIAKKSNTFVEPDIAKWLMCIEASYIVQNGDISEDILREINQTILFLKNKRIRKEDHVAYVLLNLEYAYKGNAEKDSISPKDYLRECGNFYASLEQRSYLANHMIDIAKELCKEGIGYNSALNCLKSAVEILTDIAQRNRCYLRDLEVVSNMKDNLERLMPTLNENKKLRFIFDPEK